MFSNFSPRKVELNYSQFFQANNLDSTELLFCRGNYIFLEIIYYYSLTEFSGDNIVCLAAIYDFQKNPTPEKIQFIFGNFVKKGCQFEVNISSKVRNKITMRIKNKKFSFSRQRRNAFVGTEKALAIEMVVPTIFKETGLLGEAIGNLTETMTRFSGGDEKKVPLAETIVRFKQLTANMLAHNFIVPKGLLKLK